MKSAAKAVLAALLLAAPAAAADLKEGLALKKEGKLPEAQAVFAELAAADPRDADALEQLATVQGWRGDYAASVRTWNAALALRPDSGDDRLGLARVLYWSGKHAEALAALGAGPKDAETEKLRADIGRAVEASHPPRWRLDAGYGADRFTARRSGEYGAYGQLGWQPDRSDSLWVREDYLRQFGQTDRMFNAGGSILLADRVLLLGSAGATPKPHFRPRAQAELGAEVTGLGLVTPLAAVRYFEYGSGSVRILTPGARVRLTPWADLEGRWSVSRNTDATTTYGWSARLNLAAGERWASYLGWAHGTEDIPPQATAKVTYYSAGVVWSAARNWGLRLDVGHEDRPGFYKHDSIGGGATLKY